MEDTEALLLTWEKAKAMLMPKIAIGFDSNETSDFDGGMATRHPTSMGEQRRRLDYILIKGLRPGIEKDTSTASHGP